MENADLLCLRHSSFHSGLKGYPEVRLMDNATEDETANNGDESWMDDPVEDESTNDTNLTSENIEVRFDYKVTKINIRK